VIATGVTQDDLYEALARCDPNVSLNRVDRMSGTGLRWQFTLRVKSSKGKYHRRSPDMPWRNGRRLVACCYHGHWEFLNHLFDIAPEAIVRTTMATYKGKRDFLEKAPAVAYHNQGSRMYPTDYGDACDCGPKEDEVVTVRTKMVRQGDLTGECWSVQVWGLEACMTCEYADTKECGGPEVRKAMAAGERDPAGLPG
jgi:hypothetical protein